MGKRGWEEGWGMRGMREEGNAGSGDGEEEDDESGIFMTLEILKFVMKLGYENIKNI